MVRIVVDSTCDIPKPERDALGLTMVPLKIIFEDGLFRDGVDLTNSEFYERLGKASRLPTTSQVNPAEFEDVFREIIDDTEDDIVCICMSSNLSGTYNSAVSAADIVAKDRIHCVDSNSASFGSYLIIKEAVRMRDSGMSAREIAAKSQDISKRLNIIAMVDTLKYLRMGGRLSGVSAIIGELLGIHPIVKISKGIIEVVGKARGQKASLQKLLDFFLEERVDFSHGVTFGHSNAPEKLSKFMDLMSGHIRTEDVLIGNLGSVIGAHIGPGGVGLAYVSHA
ncbi:MAG: DegV family protein [Clostridiales bacterium]|jgi:DegV family protein with EDD domain|nr:DegV family protein [Clostridiales bacterium]